MGINGKTKQFEAQLAALVSKSGLPVCVARLCVASVLSQLTALEARAVEQEAQAAKADKQEAQAEGHE